MEKFTVADPGPLDRKNLLGLDPNPDVRVSRGRTKILRIRKTRKIANFYPTKDLKFYLFTKDRQGKIRQQVNTYQAKIPLLIKQN
jgi:hypothetical protein